MEKNADSRFDITCSSANFFDYCHPQAIKWPTSQLSNYAELAGYTGGIQWHSFRSLSKYQLLYFGAPQRSQDAITSAHQSFVGETSPFTQHLILPNNEASLRDIQILQRRLGRKLPTVLYPGASKHKPYKYGFKEATFQPTPEVFSMWRARDHADLLFRAGIFGYDGLAVDVAHTNKKADPEKGEVNDYHPLEDNLDKLFPHAKEVHVRVASEFDQKEALEELKNLLDGNPVSRNLRVLRHLKDYKKIKPHKDIRVVVEVPASAFKALEKTSGKFIRTEDLFRWHGRLFDAVDGVLNH